MDRPIRLTSLTGVGESRFRVEILDDDVLVLDTHLHLIHRVHGTDVDDLLAGRPSTAAGHLPAESLPALRAALDARPVARRKVLMSGGALAASGIVTLGLPFAAAAASRTLGVYPPDADFIVFDGNTNSNVYRDYNTTNQVTAGTARILLRATDGGDGGVDQDASGGSGSYVAFTLSNIPSGGTLAFRTGQGGDGGAISGTTNGTPATLGGDGGFGVGVAWVPSSGSPVWLAVAGGGGGAGGGFDGGDYGQPGAGGTRGGRAGTTTAVGDPGVTTHGEQGRSRLAWRGGGPVTTAPSAIGSRATLDGGFDSFLGGAAELRPAALQGGGGGAGYYQGGGGLSSSTAATDDGGGGGGGSNFFLTTEVAGRPNVSLGSVTETANGAPLASGVSAWMFVP